MTKFGERNEKSILESVNLLNRKKDQKATWSVSLGDLLTLLLCFILSLVANGFIKPLENVSLDRENSNKINEIQKNEKMSKKRHPFGTALASNNNEDVKKLYFAASDFNDVDGLSISAKERLVRFSDRYISRQIRLRLCRESDSSAQLLKRALSLREELLTEGIGHSQLQIEILGQDCQMLRSKKAQNALVAIEARV